MRLSINQRGVSNILFPLIILAAIGLGVYLVGRPTNITPHAEEAVTQAPSGCIKVTPGNRQVRYKNCTSSSQNCGDTTNLLSSNQEQDVDPNYQFDGKVVATYALKESVWDFGQGWKNFNTKGPRQSDGERGDVGAGRFDGPNNKSYTESGATELSGGGYKIKYGSGEVIEYAYSTQGTNYQGLPGNRYDPSRSYAFVPSDSNSTTKCDGTSSTGSKKTGESCTKGSDCQSGSCTNNKCDATGVKKGGEACTKGTECQSGQCSNNKCSGGSRTTGSACDNNSDCASNKCENSRCVSATASSSPRSSSSPRPSGSSSTGGGGGGGGGGGTTSSPSPGSSASPAPSGSAAASTSPSPAPSGSGTVTPVPVSLTKAEITGFKSSFEALYARLGTTKDTGNLKIVSDIAKNELDSIVSQLPTCPDDANVGKCLDQKFRTRFDFAKTAARLTAFYAIFNGVSGICVKSDFGLNPLITSTSQNNQQGRVNLCTEPTAAQKIWRIFVGGKFEQILSTDTTWPANPTCATLPQAVTEHYRNAEKLFNTQSGFTENTLCDGKTLVVPGGGI